MRTVRQISTGRWWAAAGVGLIFAAASAASAEEKTYPGKHVNVVCDFDDPAVGKAALAAAEAAWDKAAELMGVKSPPLKERRKLYIYETITGYEDAERERTNGVFAKNLAFSCHNPRESHVVLQPVMNEAVRKRVGLPEMTRRLIVHEIAHLCRYEYSENRKVHPRWYSDGLAWAVEAVLVDGPAKTEISANPPYIGGCIAYGKKLLERGQLPDLEAVFTDHFGKLDDSQRYTVTYLVTGFMNQESPGWLAKFAKEDGGRKPGDDYADHMGGFALKLLGGDTDKANAKFKKFITGLKWDWHERFRSLEQHPKGWLQLAFADANALAWKSPQVLPPFVIEGKAEFLPSEVQQMNVLLEGNDDGYLSVAMTAGSGVKLFRYDQRKNEWTTHGETQVDAIKAGKPFAFKVRCEKLKIIVEIEGKKVLEVTRESPMLRGLWGVGMQAGGGGIWHDVKFSVPGGGKGASIADKADKSDDKPTKGESAKEKGKGGKKGA